MLSVLGQAERSPAYKKAKAQATDVPERSQSSGPSALSNADLTRLLQHDRDLSQLLAASSLAYKFELDNSLAAKMFEANHAWQAHHQHGKPHAMGACSTALGTVILKSSTMVRSITRIGM